MFSLPPAPRAPVPVDGCPLVVGAGAGAQLGPAGHRNLPLRTAPRLALDSAEKERAQEVKQRNKNRTHRA